MFTVLFPYSTSSLSHLKVSEVQKCRKEFTVHMRLVIHTCSMSPPIYMLVSNAVEGGRVYYYACIQLFVGHTCNICSLPSVSG